MLFHSLANATVNHIIYNLVQFIDFNQIALCTFDNISVPIDHITMLLQILSVRCFNNHSGRNAIIYTKCNSTIQLCLSGRRNQFSFGSLRANYKMDASTTASLGNSLDRLITSLSHDCPCALVSMRTSVSPT